MDGESTCISNGNGVLEVTSLRSEDVSFRNPNLASSAKFIEVRSSPQVCLTTKESPLELGGILHQDMRKGGSPPEAGKGNETRFWLLQNLLYWKTDWMKLLY